MPSDFYHWLILASLKATVILPVALLAAWVSRRTSSAIIALLLACALIAVPLSPLMDFIPSNWKIPFPALKSTGAFPDDLPELVQYDEQNPLPSPAGSIRYVEEQWLTTERIVICLWALGFAGVALARIWRSLNLRLRFSSSTPAAAEDEVLEEIRSLSQYLKIKKPPWLMYNTSIRGPQTTGILRPIILVPNHFATVPQEQRMMILLHEMAHIRRKDIPVRIFLEVLSLLLWFHPLVWLLLRQYDLQTEKACDDVVLHADYPAAKYGEALLASVRGNTPSSGTMVSAPRQLRTRMFSVVDKTKLRHPLNKHSVLKFALLFTTLLIPLSLVSFSPYQKTTGYEIVHHTGELRALWRMKLGQGSIVADSSGANRHGQIFGAEWVQDPVRGNCLSFDGIDDLLLLRAPDATWTDQPFTLCLWLKPAKGSDGGGLLLRGDLNQTWCSAVGSGSISENYGEREIMLSGPFSRDQFAEKIPGLHPGVNYWGVAAAHANQPIPDDKWTHLAIVWRPTGDMAIIDIYFNAKPVETIYLQTVQRNVNRDWPATVWHFAAGESLLVQGNHFEGLASDLAIYQKRLMPKDIKRVMHGDFSSPQTSRD